MSDYGVSDFRNTVPRVPHAEVRRTYARPYDYDGSYDLREDECLDCGFDIPSGLCDCRPGIPPYTNGDRMDDVDAHRPMGDGRSTYIDGD